MFSVILFKMRKYSDFHVRFFQIVGTLRDFTVVTKTDKNKCKSLYTPYANMADHSVVAWNELYESEASWVSLFCFDNASSEKSCFVRDLVFFILLRLRVFIFLNATRGDRNCPAFASKGKRWIHAIH